MLVSSILSYGDKIDSLKIELAKASGKDKIHILNEIGKTYWYIDPEKILEYGQQALELSEKENYPKGKGQSLNNIGVGNYFLGNYEAALDHFLRSLEIREDIGFKRDIVGSYNNLAVLFDDMSEPEKSLEYYHKSLSLYEKLNDKDGIAYTLHNIAVIYENLSNYHKALEYFLKAKKIYEEIQDKFGIANTFANIGMVYKDLSNYDKALKFQLQSLEICKELDYKDGIANSLDEIGKIYVRLNNYEKAVENYLKSIKIEEEIGDKKGVANSLNNIGMIYDEQGEFLKAIEYYNRSMNIYLEFENKEGYGNCLNNIGVAYKNLGQYYKAIDFQEQALQIFQEIQFKKGIAASKNNLGAIYLQLEDHENSRKYLMEALELAVEIETKDLTIEIYETLSRLYSKKENYRKALEYFKLYSQVKDSVLTKEKIERIAGMQMEYEVKLLIEEQEKEIALLQKDNEIYRLEAEKQKFTKWRLYSGLILVLILVFFIYYRFRLNSQANKLLQEKVDKRTRDLTIANENLTNEIIERKQLEAQLRISERLAGIGELAAGVAHEIRNPITILKSTAQFCQSNYSELSAEKISKIMDIFTETSDRINKTVKDLLEFAQPSLDDFTRGNITNIIKKVYDFLEDKFKSHKIDFKISREDKLPSILLDEDQLYGAFLNLLLNSIEAMPEGGEINLQIIKNKDKITISIKDSGMGIPAENLQKIFNPFFTTKEHGTGLGLSLVHNVMNFHQGRINITSKENMGTKVILEFPIENEKIDV